MKLLFALVVIGLLSAAFFKVQHKDHKVLQVVSTVDLQRYTGKWYEIARLPNKFQKDCVGEVLATYTLLEGSQLKVVNQCRKQNGQLEQAEGKARLADKNGPNAKLEVRFAPAWLSWLPLVWGDYWIIELANDYSYAVVGTPDREFLWILARSPQLEEETFRRLIENAAAAGFDTAQVVKTRQVQ